ncbi:MULTISPECIES: hypothetical protein [unclassified Streptomyces]
MTTPPAVLAALIREMNAIVAEHGDSGTSRVMVAQLAQRYGRQALADAVAYDRTRRALTDPTTL